MYAAPKKALSSPKTGSPRRRGLDKCMTTACVTSVAELTELVHQARQRFSDAYQSKDNKFMSQVDWATNALHTLSYFMKCSHQIDEDISDILAATRRAHSQLPPLVEWLRVASLHVEHRGSSIVDDDDVRQAARLLLPFNDCEPRALCPTDSLTVSSSLSPTTAAVSFQQDLGLRLLLSGRVDVIPQALVMLGPEKANTINLQGMTPLMYACAYGNEALVKRLIECHALLDTQVPNNKQIYPLLNLELISWTALSFAAMKGHVNVCQLLLDAGANPNGAMNHGKENQVETPLQLAAATGNYEVVSMLLRKAADPYVSVNTCSFSPGLRGFGNAYAAAAAHGLKNILRKLLAEPGPRRENDMLSLTEILTEGSLSDEGNEMKLTKKKSMALEEALYHSCEHGFLEIAMELRSLGVPWNIHCWSQTVGHAYERGQKAFLECLLRDFQSMPTNEYTSDFCEDGLVILFNIFKECEDLALSKELASVLSCCFSRQPLKEIEILPITQTSIRIGPDYINSPEMSDITFVVEGRPFYAHKIILATASKKFKAMLSNKTIEPNDGSTPCIEITDIKYEIFMLVIQFLYSGTVDDPVHQNKILELLQASQYFMLDSLKRHCERFAAKHLDCENVVDTYVFANLCEAKELLSYCAGFILKNLAAMMEVKNFRDTLFNNNSNELLQALKSCLIERIKANSTAKPPGRSPVQF
ncbi:ankyrin repeat and BTB/POZ domain-containing protein 3-like isoform X3 [Pocillopora verrucosa]